MMFLPDKHRFMHEYMYAVITETLIESHTGKVLSGRRKYKAIELCYHVGQIVIVDITGGNNPMEVGSGVKLGKVDCAWELYGTLDRAINMANKLWGIDS